MDKYHRRVFKLSAKCALDIGSVNCLFYPDSQHLFPFSILCLEWNEICIHEVIGKIWCSQKYFIKKPFWNISWRFFKQFFPLGFFLIIIIDMSETQQNFTNLIFFYIRKVQQFWVLKSYETFILKGSLQIPKFCISFIQSTASTATTTCIHMVLHIHAQHCGSSKSQRQRDHRMISQAEVSATFYWVQGTWTEGYGVWLGDVSQRRGFSARFVRLSG